MYKAIQWMIEIFCWLRIVVSPTIIGCIAGIIIYSHFHTRAGLVISVMVAAAGLLAGILWANKIWKTQGTSWFLSRPTHSPDFNVSSKTQKKS